jgi:uncharacterized SAM-binding protein YcdF (DUF218 family)
VFFFLSKVLDVLLSPLTWVLIFVAVGIRRTPTRVSRIAPAIGLIVLCIFSSGRVSNGLARHLEENAPRTIRDGVTYDAVIVLGGFIDGGATVTYGERAYNENIERLLTAYDFLRTGRAKNAILSGGPIGGGLIESRVMADQLVAWGIARERLVLDETSRNTRENAVNSQRLAHEKNFASLLLITSAYHMERALGCFHAVDLAVDTLPVDYRAFNPSRIDTNIFPRAGYLYESTSALREMAGRLIYRVLGYSK